MYHELIGCDLKLPIQGALFVNNLYPATKCCGKVAPFRYSMPVLQTLIIVNGTLI